MAKSSFIGFCPEILLQLFSLQLDDNKPLSWKIKINGLILKFLFILYILLEQAHLVQSMINGEPVEQVTEDMLHSLNHTLGFYRYYLMLKFKTKLATILNSLENVTDFYEKNAYFDVLSIQNKHIALMNRFVSFYLGIAIMFAICAVIDPLYTDSEIQMIGNGTYITTKALPFKTWVPFPEGLLPHYYFVFAYQIFSLTIIISVILLYTMINHGIFTQIIAQCKVLNMAIMSTSERITLSSQNENKIDDEVYWQVQKYIKHHKYIRCVSSEISEVFGSAYFIQICTSTAVICVALFQTFLISGVKFVSMIGYCSAVTIDMFTLCYFGQAITDEEHKLSTSLFSIFINMKDKKSRSVLKTFHLFTVRPLIFTALGFFPVNLTTFGAVMKKSYSIFNVLRQHRT